MITANALSGKFADVIGTGGSSSIKLTQKVENNTLTLTVTRSKSEGSDSDSTPATYTIRFDLNGADGSVASQSVAADSAAKRPADPKRAGYEFTGWYTDKDCTEKYDFTAKVTNGLTLYAGWDKVVKSGMEPWENPFFDVKAGDWFYGDVRFVYEAGIMNGIRDDLFGRSGTTTRGMVVTVMWRLAGEPESEGDGGFIDLTQDWYREATVWAAENSIAEGYGNGFFGPEDKITREQLVTMIYRYAKWVGLDVTASAALDGFSGAGEVSDWALPAMRWAVAVGIIQGRDDGSIDPGGNVTRAELAAVLHRFLEV